MSCTKIKTGWLVALGFALATHVGGFLIFSFRDAPQVQTLQDPTHLEFIDLSKPENLLALEVALLNDPASLYQPTAWSFTQDKPYRLDDFLLEQSTEEISPRLAIGSPGLQTFEMREGFPQAPATIVAPRTASVLRPLGQTDRAPRQINALSLSASFIPTSRGFTREVSKEQKVFRFLKPEGLESREIWRPLQLGVWVDPTGTIPPPLIEESTGDEDRDQILIELLLNEIRSLDIAPGYYTVLLGI